MLLPKAVLMAKFLAAESQLAACIDAVIVYFDPPYFKRDKGGVRLGRAGRSRCDAGRRGPPCAFIPSNEELRPPH